MKRFAMLPALFVAMLVLVQCAPSAPPASTQAPAAGPTTLTLSMTSSPKFFNPIFQGDGYSQTTWGFIHAGLIRFNEKLEPSPWLAEKWSISDDGTTYTFNLNPKAKWHDGTAVSANDVKLTLQLIASKATSAFNYSRFTAIKGYTDYFDGKAGDIAGIETPDERTVKITLNGPSAPFLANLASYFWLLPTHVLGGVAPDQIAKHAYNTNPIGAGPYKFVQYVTDQYVEFAKFRDYVLGEPQIDKIILRIGTQDVLQAQLEKGEVDAAAVTPLDVERTKKLPNVQVLSWATDVWQSIHVNLTRPYLQDKRVRQALMYGLNRQAMVDTLFKGQATLVNGPSITPAWAVNPKIATYPFDIAKAKDLLKAAGWDSSRKLIMRVPTGDKPREQSGPIIQQALKDIGVETEIQMSDFPTLAKDLQTQNYDLALVGFWSGADPDVPSANFNSAFVHPKGFNFTVYKNPRVDELYDKGRVMVKQESRKANYDEVQSIINDELPVVFLWTPNAIEGINARVKGLKPVTGLIVYWNIQEWSVTQ